MEDLDIFYYLKILTKRLKFIIFIIIIFILGSIIISLFFLPKIYSGSCIMLLPKVGKDIILNTSELELLIKNRDYLTLTAESIGLNYNDIKDNLFISIKDNLLILTFEYVNKNEIIIFLNNLYSSLNEIIKPIYDNRIKILTNKIKSLDQQIENLEKIRNELYENLENINKKDKEKYDLYLEYSLNNSTYVSLLENLHSLKKEKLEIEEYLELSRPFSFIKEPCVSNLPIKPNLLFNIILATILGFLLSIILSFLIEFWK